MTQLLSNNYLEVALEKEAGVPKNKCNRDAGDGWYNNYRRYDYNHTAIRAFGPFFSYPLYNYKY